MSMLSLLAAFSFAGFAARAVDRQDFGWAVWWFFSAQMWTVLFIGIKAGWIK